jgi:N-acylneuraminate cytidylyltransferase
MNKITAIIPVRAGSRRLKNKNILQFGDTNLLIRKIR